VPSTVRKHTKRGVHHHRASSIMICVHLEPGGFVCAGGGGWDRDLKIDGGMYICLGLLYHFGSLKEW